MSTLKKRRDELAAKQAKLQEVFAESKNDDGEYDFTRVTCLGDTIKGSQAVAEEVTKRNAELDDIAKECESLEAAEKAAGDQAAREKTLEGFRHADPGKSGAPDRRVVKSLGEEVAGSDRYAEWLKSGAAGGMNFSIADMLPSDALAKGMRVATLGAKADFETSAGWAPESVRMPGFVEAVTRPIQLLDIIPLRARSRRRLAGGRRVLPGVFCRASDLLNGV